MQLTKKFSETILNSIFNNYFLDFEIEILDDDNFTFRIKQEASDCDNEQQQIFLYENKDEFNKIGIDIYIYKKNEDTKKLGTFVIEIAQNGTINHFYKEKDFWETMFIEHIKF